MKFSITGFRASLRGKNDMKIQDYRDQVYLDDGEAGTRIEPGIANKMIKKTSEI